MPIQSNQRLVIETNEGFSFSMQLASPLARALAWMIDALVMLTVLTVVSTIVAIFGVIDSGLAAAAMALSYFVVAVGYFIYCEWRMRGQTPGKRLFKLRVIDADGLKLKPSQIVIRNLLRVVDGLPLLYALGGTVSLFNRQSQRLGDMAAATVVIRIPSIQEPDLAVLQDSKYNSFRQFPHLEAQLRQKTDPLETDIALQALRRREKLEPAARVKIFHTIAEYFRSVVRFPEEATVGITDEQYVRNCVETIFRQRL